MKQQITKLLLVILLAAINFTQVFAGCPVTVMPGNGSTSGNARAPLGTFNFMRGVYLITPAEMATAGFANGSVFSKIGWTYSTGQSAAATGTLKVYFENTTNTSLTKSTTWATAISTMSLAHSASTTLPAAAGAFDITLTGGAPFTYTGSGLYVAYEFSNPVLTTGCVIACSNVLLAGSTNGLESAQSNSALPTLLAASAFRPETRLAITAGASVCYCTPVSTNGGAAGDAITAFNFATLSYSTTTAIAAPGYADLTSTTIVAGQGVTYPVSLSNQYSGDANNIWIDYNDNATLNDVGEGVFQGGPGTSVSGSITISGSAPLGLHRLRLRNYDTGVNALGSVTPCSGVTYGETKDFKINIVPPTYTDAQVTNIYTLGKVAIEYGSPLTIKARVVNGGATTLSSYNVHLAITGNNSFTDDQTVTLTPGQNTLVTFAPYTPTALSAGDVITVSVASDDDNTNNSQSWTQAVTQNLYSYKNPAQVNAGGVGFTGGTGDFVAKFNSHIGTNFPYNVYSPQVNLISVDFFATVSPTQTYQLGIWDATGAGGTPGVNLWTSGILTQVGGTSNVPVPNISVSGDYYVGVRQTGTTNINFAFQNEAPIRSGTFYYTAPTGGTTWNDFSSTNSNFRFSIVAQVRIPQAPDCPINMSPADLSTVCPINPVTLSWGPGGGASSDNYDVYLSTNQADVIAHAPAAHVSTAQTGTTYNAGSLTPGQTYYWTLVANSTAEALSSVGCSVFSFTMGTSFLNCYCTPEHTPGCGNGNITNVTFNTLNNTTTCSGSAYTAFPASGTMTTSVDKGSTYPLSVTTDQSCITSVWIDFNHNGSLDASEWTQVALASTPNVADVVNIPIPMTALPGQTLMRIRSRFAGNPNGDVDACTVFGSGEGEDYIITINCGGTASSNSAICNHTTLNLLSGPTGATFSWTGPASYSSAAQNPSLTNATLGTNDGSYNVNITSTGCNENIPVSVIINPLPTVSPTVSSPFCEGTANLDLFANAPTATSFSWTGPGSLNNSAIANPSVLSAPATASGSYTVSVTDANGCTNSNSVSATVYALPPVDITTIGSTNLCTGQTTSDLQASGAVSYSWSTGETTSLITVNTQGTYTVTGTDVHSCINTDVQVITESAAPTAPIVTPAGSIVLCTDGFTTTSVNLTCVNYSSSLLWSTSETTQMISVDYADNFNVTYTDVNGCYAVSNSVVTSVDNYSTAPTGASSNAPFNNICLGNTVTLSVDGGSLGDNAQWKWYEGGCGSGAAIATGASPTITPATAGSHTYYVRAESVSCGNTSCSSITIAVSANIALATVHYTASASTGCNGSSAVFTTNAVAGATFYNWSGTSGALFNGSPGPVQTATPTVNVTFASPPPGGASGYNICSFAGNACTSSNTICTWVRSKVSQPGTISGSNIGCAGNNGTYSIAAVGGADSYTWTVTGAAGINGGGATLTTTSTSITVNFLGGWTSGTVSVYASLACGFNSAARSLNISSTPAQPGTMSGPSYVCSAVNPNNYSVAPVAGASSYNWTCNVPGSVVVPSSNSCSITFPAVIPAGSSVSVVAVSSCGGLSPVRSKGIASGLPGTPGNITGPSTGNCNALGVSYTVSSTSSGATSYLWNITGGATIQLPNNLSGVSIDFPNNFSSGTITVNGVNACGNGGARTLLVYGAPALPGAISGNPTPCANSVETYSTTGSAGATSYNWGVPAGASILGIPPYGPSITVQLGASSGNVTVSAVNSCGNSATRSAAVTISCRQSQISEASTGILNLYPNPTRGKAELSFNSSSSENAVVTVTDLLGRIVHTENFKISEGQNIHEADLTNLAKGVYLIHLQGGELNEVVKVTVE